MPTTSRLLRESSFFAIARVAPTVASFYVLALGAHSLDDTAFVVLVTLGATYAVFGMLDLGMGSAAQAHAAGLPRSRQIATFLFAGRRIFATTVPLIAASGTVALFVPYGLLVFTGLTSALLNVPMILVDRYRAIRQEMAASSLASIANAAAIAGLATLAAAAEQAQLLIVVTPVSTLLVNGVHAALVLLRHHAVGDPVEDMTGHHFGRTSVAFFSTQASWAFSMQYAVLLMAFMQTPIESRGYSSAWRIAAAGGSVLASTAHASWAHIAGTRGSAQRGAIVQSARVIGGATLACFVGAVVAGTGVMDRPVELLLADQAPDRTTLVLLMLLLGVWCLSDGLQWMDLAIGSTSRQLTLSVLNCAVLAAALPVGLWLWGPASTLIIVMAARTAVTTVPTSICLWRHTNHHTSLRDATR